MRKLILPLFLVGLLTGCPTKGAMERNDLKIEITNLKSQIEIAKEVELLKAERDDLQKELDAFTTRPEANAASKKTKNE